MVITLSTVLSLMLYGSIAILLFNYVLSKSDAVLKLGIRKLLFLMIILLIRLFFPFEIPFQKNIVLTRILPNIYAVLAEPSFSLFHRNWSILNIILVVSVVVSVFLILKLVLSYLIFVSKTSKYKALNDKLINEQIAKINRNFKRSVTFKVVETNIITSPIIFGFFKPCIILPKIELTEDEWYYVLYHEISHFYTRDLWIRFASELLQVLYWWNPFIYMFRNQISRTQELRIDLNVISKLNELQRTEYLECLIKVAKLQVNDKKKRLIATFSSDSANEVTKRIGVIFRYISESSDNKKVSTGVLCMEIILILCIFFIPNFFIIEPYGIFSEDAENTFAQEEIYLIQKSDGTYELYNNDTYIRTFIELPDVDIKILDERGKIIK
jgi:beta-lactamase regulating signal transducer with metallopeptidase domain